MGSWPDEQEKCNWERQYCITCCIPYSRRHPEPARNLRRPTSEQTRLDGFAARAIQRPGDIFAIRERPFRGVGPPSLHHAWALGSEQGTPLLAFSIPISRSPEQLSTPSSIAYRSPFVRCLGIWRHTPRRHLHDIRPTLLVQYILAARQDRQEINK